MILLTFLFLFKIDYEDDMSQSFDDKYSYAVSPGTSNTTSLYPAQI